MSSPLHPVHQSTFQLGLKPNIICPLLYRVKKTLNLKTLHKLFLAKGQESRPSPGQPALIEIGPLEAATFWPLSICRGNVWHVGKVKKR